MFNGLDEAVNLAVDSYNSFIGIGAYHIIYFLLMLFLFFMEKEKNNRIILCFGVYSLIIIFINLNPVFAKVSEKIIGEAVYWRVWWLIPISLGVSYFLTILITKGKNKTEEVVLTVLAIMIIMVAGTNIYENKDLKKVNNYSKLPDEFVDVIEFLSREDNSYKKLAGPHEFSIYTRVLDGNIILAEGRHFNGIPKNSIITYINNLDYESINKYCDNRSVNYIIFNADKEIDELEFSGFEKIYSNEKYILYYNKDIVAKN